MDSQASAMAIPTQDLDFSATCRNDLFPPITACANLPSIDALGGTECEELFDCSMLPTNSSSLGLGIMQRAISKRPTAKRHQDTHLCDPDRPAAKASHDVLDDAERDELVMCPSQYATSSRGLGITHRAIAKRPTVKRHQDTHVCDSDRPAAKASREVLRDIIYEVDTILQGADVCYAVAAKSGNNAPRTLRYVLGTLFAQPLPVIKQPVTELRALCALIGEQFVLHGICDTAELSANRTPYASVPVARVLLRFITAYAALITEGMNVA
eukprot:TRINITY_DN4705_c0_g1_i2.p1 TRINITY_DN4705_c0_g1~~TRINITY_DN4705_c0_g1_i2.p1  ORF type:complete len:286 (-),score=42.64 TRINITY_DN4705_c0_g1_i2:24-830(-)